MQAIYYYNIIHCTRQTNEGCSNNYKTTEYSQTGRVPSTAAVLPRWMATAALCIKKWINLH